MSLRLFLAVALTAVAGYADVLMDVRPSPGPNYYSSSTYGAWATNALFALENDLTAVGDPATDPAAYFLATHLGVRDNIATSSGDPATAFPSWRGYADPGTMFGPQFANEYGNVLYFGLHILGNGQQFRLSNLSYNIQSSDYWNALGFSGSFTSSDTYSAPRFGIAYGPDGLPGTADDIIIDSGSADQLVDELYYTGIGTSSLAGQGPYPEANQASLDGVAYYYTYYSPLVVNMVYSLADDSGATLAIGSATVDFSVPEPTAVGLVFAGLVILTMRRRHHAA
jgi:hypothetical protein